MRAVPTLHTTYDTRDLSDDALECRLRHKRGAQVATRACWTFVFTLFLFLAGAALLDINPPRLVRLICVTAYLLPPLIYIKWG